MPPLPRYYWDDRAGQYRGPGGRFLPRATVRAAVDDFVGATAVQVRALSAGVRGGTVSLAAWEAGMRAAIKDTHLTAAALAKGGWAQMSPADFGLVGRRVRDQYGYLRGFVGDVASGRQALDGRFEARAALYAGAGRQTYYAQTEAELGKRGAEEERSVLHPAEHCGECIEEAERGWVPLGDLVPVGARECRSNCQCSVDYR